MRGELTAERCREFAEQLDVPAPQLAETLRFRVGLAWQRCGENERAQETYSTVAGEGALLAAVQNNLGVIASESGLLEEAQGHLRRAVELDASLRTARVNLGHIHRMRYRDGGAQSAFDASMQQFQAALFLNPNDATAHTGLAHLYYERALKGESSYAVLARFALVEAWRLDMERGERSADSANLSGLLALHEGHISRALREFRSAIKLDPQAAAPRINAAYVLARTHAFHEAAQHLEVASRALGDRSVLVALSLGVARTGDEDFDGALDAYARARSLAPVDPRVDYNLATLYERHIYPAVNADGLNELHAAVEHYERFLDAVADDPRYSRAAARTRRRLEELHRWLEPNVRPHGDYEEARELERLQREQDALRRTHLLELERRARAAWDAQHPNPEGP